MASGWIAVQRFFWNIGWRKIGLSRVVRRATLAGGLEFEIYL
jgi:hypothetical protein